MLTQKQKDISLLLDIRALIMSPSQNVTLIKSLAQIGNFLHNITWNENDLECIRNKHGLRNRHKDKGNKLNTTGAKLDFETLAHITKLAKSDQADTLLLNNKAAITGSLISLKTKIDYIIAAEYDFLSEDQRNEVSINSGKLSDSEESDLGFLWRVAAYHHDQYCLNQLVILLTEFDSIVQKDLTDPIQRYNLGYLLCQLGEYAKELSCFVKPESHKQAEDNLTRFMFGKLGHYRQEIKQSPFIVRKENTQELRQMRWAIQKASPALKTLLKALQETLKIFETEGIISNYHLCSSFETTWEGSLKTITKQLRFGITFLSDLRKKSQRCSIEIASLKAQKEQLLMQLEDRPTVRHLSSDVNTVLLPNGIKEIHAILNKEELSPYLSTRLIDIKELTTSSALSSNKKLLSLLHAILKILKKESNKKYIVYCYQSTIENTDHLSLEQLNSGFATRIAEEKNETKHSGTDPIQKIRTLDKHIAQNEAELLQISQDIQSLETKLTLQPSSQIFATKSHSEESFFSYIFSEINLIESFYRFGETASSNSVKMALGWIGHYAKEIKKNTNTATNLKEYTHVLVEICFKKAEYLRSKVIMHDMANGNSTVLEQTWSEFILPTKDDIRALSNIAEGQKLPGLLLARAFMRLDEHSHALSVLEDHLANLRAGHVQFNLSVNPTDYEPHAAPLLSLWQNTRQIGRTRFGFGENAFNTIENIAASSLESSRTLILLAKCYQHREGTEDLQKGLRFIDEALQATTYQLDILRQPTAISGHGVLQTAIDSKFDEWLFCQSVKSVFLIKLDQAEKARAILLELEKKFDQPILIQSKFSTRIVRILTDLVTITKDLELQKHYIEKASEHLGRSDRKVFSAWLIQLRYYELAFQCFSEEQNDRNFKNFEQRVMALNLFFKKYKGSIQQENGMKIFEYESSVLMADLELKFTNIEMYAAQIFELFKKWDDIEKHINYDVRHKCYSLKFIYFSRRDQTQLFQECLEKFVEIGEEHNPTNFRYTLLTMLNNLIRWNLASFILMGLDFIKRKFITLTEEESTTEMIALDMQRKKTPVLSSCHFIVHDGLSAIVKQLNRITAKLHVESWGYTSDNTLVLVSTTAPFEDIKNHLKKWDIGEIRINQDRQKSICIYNLKGKNLSNIPPLAPTTKTTIDCYL